MILTHCLTRRQTDRQTEDYKSSLRMAVIILTHCLTRIQTDRQPDRQPDRGLQVIPTYGGYHSDTLFNTQTDRQTDRQRHRGTDSF